MYEALRGEWLALIACDGDEGVSSPISSATRHSTECTLLCLLDYANLKIAVILRWRYIAVQVHFPDQLSIPVLNDIWPWERLGSFHL